MNKQRKIINSLKKMMPKVFLSIFFCSLFGLFLYQNYTFGEDLMEQAFKPSINADSVLNLGNNKNAVGNEIFREGTEVSFGDGDGAIERSDLIPNVKKSPPLIVRIAKTLLRFTIMIAITMILFNGIKYIIETAKGGTANATETTKNLVFVGVGLLLSLGSLALVNLISSISISSLEIDSETISFGQTGKGCLIGDVFYAEGNDLKEIACTDGQDGIWDNSRASEKCNYAGGWKDITPEQQASICSLSLDGIYKNEVGIGCKYTSNDVNVGITILVGENLQETICTDAFGGEWKEKLIGNDMMCNKDGDKFDITVDLLYQGCKNGLGGQIIGE